LRFQCGYETVNPPFKKIPTYFKWLFLLTPETVRVTIANKIQCKAGNLRHFEALLTDISARFVNLSVEQIDGTIEDAMREICECLGVDLASLWQWTDESPRILTLTHLFSPPPPLGPERPDGINAEEAFPWVCSKVLKGETLVISTEKLPPEAKLDQASRQGFNVKSSVVIPLSVGGEPVIGVLAFDDLQVDRTWPPETVDRLTLIAQVFSNTLDRKRSELQLRESQARLSMATQSAEVGLWIMEQDTDHVWVTPQIRSLFHFEADESLNYGSFERVIDPADRKRVVQALQTSLKTDENLFIEFRVVAPNDSIRWIHARGKRLLDPNGRKFRLMGAAVDVSKRKKMEQQLNEQLDEIKNLKLQLEKDNINLRKEIELQYMHEDIVGRSPAMQHILSQVEQVAQTDATVLIEGETGTGKELLARAVHRLSGRKDRPLVTVNCASLPPTLVESEMFGREKGAYTGALTRMTGRFEMADRATLFLDEIGELPLDVQAKLLRVLELGIFERLGSTKPLQVDVRVIAATNQELSRLVENGNFRKDLFYRLNVFPIHIPPLRERPEDIPPLVWNFVRQFEHKMGRRIDHIPRHQMDDLMGYAWPGNVRELKNLIERAMIVCNSRTLEVRLPADNNVASSQPKTLEEAERIHLLSVLKQTGWRLSGPRGAAGILGLKRTTLQSKMKKLGIVRP